MGYWNHRVVRYVEPDGSSSFGIHEAFYEDGEEAPHSISQDAEPVLADSGNDMTQTLVWMREAMLKPLLDYETRQPISKRAAVFEMNEIARKQG